MVKITDVSEKLASSITVQDIKAAVVFWKRISRQSPRAAEDNRDYPSQASQ